MFAGVTTTSNRSGRSSVARATAVRATSPNSGEQISSGARESTTSLASSVPRSIVDTGTATAPMRIAARIAANSSTPSEAHMSTRCSGRTPRARSPAATRRTSPASSP